MSVPMVQSVFNIDREALRREEQCEFFRRKIEKTLYIKLSVAIIAKKIW